MLCSRSLKLATLITKTMHQLNLENLKKYLVENVKVSTTISNTDFDIKQFK